MVKLGHILLLIMCSIFLRKGKAADLIATPENIVIGGQNPSSNLTLTCTPDAEGITVLTEISIRKFGDGRIAQITTSGVTADESKLNRMNFTGNINGSTGILRVVLTQLQCSDGGYYSCSNSYNNGRVGGDNTFLNVPLRSYPEDVSKSVLPDNTVYESNTEVQFNCTGKIGNQINQGMSNLWRWEWRSTDGDNTQWKPFPNTNSITYLTPVDVGNCQYYGGSVLTHTLTSEDNGKQFRCYAVGSSFGGSKTINIQSSTKAAETTATTAFVSSSSEAQTTADTTTIIPTTTPTVETTPSSNEASSETDMSSQATTVKSITTEDIDTGVSGAVSPGSFTAITVAVWIVLYAVTLHYLI